MHKNTFKNRYSSNGFTMIELLIVIVILGLLASLVAPKMFSKVSSSQRSTAAAQMQMLETSLDTFRLDLGTYPAKLEDLRKSTGVRWDGPYLPKDVPLDPWGNPYVYTVPGDEPNPYKILSYAADGKPGGTENNADIVHK